MSLVCVAAQHDQLLMMRYVCSQNRRDFVALDQQTIGGVDVSRQSRVADEPKPAVTREFEG